MGNPLSPLRPSDKQDERGCPLSLTRPQGSWVLSHPAPRQAGGAFSAAVSLPFSAQRAGAASPRQGVTRSEPRALAPGHWRQAVSVSRAQSWLACGSLRGSAGGSRPPQNQQPRLGPLGSGRLRPGACSVCACLVSACGLAGVPVSSPLPSPSPARSWQAAWRGAAGPAVRGWQHWDQ